MNERKKVFTQVCSNCMVIDLTKKEAIALDAIKEGIYQGYQSDEITELVADELDVSLNTAKGYIGQLCKKGVVKKHITNDYNVGRIVQFSINT